MSRLVFIKDGPFSGSKPMGNVNTSFIFILIIGSLIMGIVSYQLGERVYYDEDGDYVVRPDSKEER